MFPGTNGILLLSPRNVLLVFIGTDIISSKQPPSPAKVEPNYSHRAGRGSSHGRYLGFCGVWPEELANIIRQRQQHLDCRFGSVTRCMGHLPWLSARRDEARVQAAFPAVNRGKREQDEEFVMGHSCFDIVGDPESLLSSSRDDPRYVDVCKSICGLISRLLIRTSIQRRDVCRIRIRSHLPGRSGLDHLPACHLFARSQARKGSQARREPDQRGEKGIEKVKECVLQHHGGVSCEIGEQI